MKVILDTNFLIYCAKNKIDYTEEIERVVKEGFIMLVFRQTIEELENLIQESKKYSDREAARLALKIVKADIKDGIMKLVDSDHNAKYADEALRKYLKEKQGQERVIVATVDRKLQKRVKKQASVLVIKGRKKIGFS